MCTRTRLVLLVFLGFFSAWTDSSRVRAADGEQNRFIHIPIQVTKQWQKVTLTPDTHPQMNEIDTKRVYIVGLGDSSEEGAANVIWLDEVKLLLQDDKGEF